MDDGVVAGEAAPHAGRVEQVELAHLDRKAGQVLDAEIRTHQRGHFKAAPQQFAHHLGPDEAVRAGDGAAAKLGLRS